MKIIALSLLCFCLPVHSEENLATTVSRDFGKNLTSLGASRASRQVLESWAASLDWTQIKKLKDEQKPFSVASYFHQQIRKYFEHHGKVDIDGDAPSEINDMVTEGRANCFGTSKLFWSLAKATGLNPQPVHIQWDRSGSWTIHVANRIADGKGSMVFVDLVHSPEGLSHPLRINETYRTRAPWFEILNQRNTEIPHLWRDFTIENLALFDRVGLAYFDKNKMRLAKELARKDPTNPHAYKYLAEASSNPDGDPFSIKPEFGYNSDKLTKGKVRNLLSAIEFYKEAVAREPKDWMSRRGLAEIYGALASSSLTPNELKVRYFVASDELYASVLAIAKEELRVARSNPRKQGVNKVYLTSNAEDVVSALVDSANMKAVASDYLQGEARVTKLKEALQLLGQVNTYDDDGKYASNDWSKYYQASALETAIRGRLSSQARN